MTINNCAELWSEWMGGEETEERALALLEKYVFKGTECGCVFHSDEKGIMVGGYAEGSDAELPMHDLEWGFTIDEFNEALDYADKEGCIAWHEANELDLGNMITEEEWNEETSKNNPGSN